MSLNSEVFYDGTLVCGTPPERCMAVLMQMPNPSIQVAFIDVPSEAIQSVTSSYRNEAEAQIVHVLVRNLLIKGFHSREIMVIYLYKDQKLLRGQLLNPLGVSAGSLSCLRRLPIWENMITWCESHNLVVPMDFFNDVA
ncbi:hypothetical protein ANCCEY_15877 [Ancylostoma ceylanicum]|uniref:DNA2/NAM7 helicase-like C-terminal domain-containing protein n=1 Tax=Ancylostoma ceylanicum TaxID=53326 RepID=A0A0D6L389_9BILA|nr:hypothetical protein ANCCEY_15877 [Ancylostoma ceylanicum]